YDNMSHLTNVVWKTNGGALATFYYRLGSAGNRTNLSEVINGTAGTYTWQYDCLSRLTNENISGFGIATYRYDLVGNRTDRSSTITGLTNQTYSFNTNDWLTVDLYDNNGNTTNSSGISYQYDVLSRMINGKRHTEHLLDIVSM